MPVCCPCARDQPTGSHGSDGDAGRLGFGVLGNAAWDAQARVRLRLGPLTRAQYDAFLPGGDAHEALCSIARLYAADEVGVDAQLVLARGEVPPCMLGPPARDGPTPPRDPDETALRLC